MAEYIMFFRFTQKGAEKIKESPNRIKAAKKMFDAEGAKVKAFYAVLGRYDTMFLVEAANDETIAKLSLQISALGNVHVESMRAFNEEEFSAIIRAC